MSDNPSQKPIDQSSPQAPLPLQKDHAPQTATSATGAPDEKTALHMSPGKPDEKVEAPPVVTAAVQPPAATGQLPPTAPLKEKSAAPAAPDDTLARKPSTSTAEVKAVVSAIVPPANISAADLENPYILSGEVDRARLVAQTRLFRNYVEKNAKQYLGENIKSILDIGCGEGQLTLAFAKLYPEARIVGIDRDEKAIEVAQRAAKGMPNVEFVTGDIQESLPKGPFDLVYASVVLMHVPNTTKVLQNVIDVLQPEGYFWSKDHHSSMATAVDHPAFKRLGDWMGAAVDRIGGHWRIGAELADILTTAGFRNVHAEREIYTLGNKTSEERVTMSINLGALYNSRKLTNRVLGVPESDVEKAYKEILDAMMAPNGPRGDFLYMNTIGQRPVSAKPSTDTVEQKAAVSPIVPPGADTLPDIENPYILSGEVDRARLVAQTRLFRAYIEKNAKLFLGENIKSILDMGCGEGQLALVFARLYPEAHIVGVDKDENAIEVARRAAKGVPNVEFHVGDILQGLPAGPFDLVYASMVFMHVPGTPKVVKSVYDILKPGGRLWTKDPPPDNANAINHPAWTRLAAWTSTTMDRVGAPYKVASELPPLLTSVGFNPPRREKEVYALGNMNTTERINLSTTVGALYNARKLISKVLQMPESEIETAYKEVVAAMMAPGGPRGDFTYINTIAQRPETAS